MRNLTLLTDLYELTMAQAYFLSDCQATAVFDVFYRKNPSNGGYAVFAGLEQVVQYISRLHFSDEDISYLRSLGLFKEEFLSYLKNFRFSGNLYAVPEGSVIFPKEPIVKVIAPIIEAQFIETAVLNILNHQCLIATKAARICYAAKNNDVAEFGLRRAQGPDSAVYGARAAFIGGCKKTSNVLAGKLFDIPVSGTHAHSFIMSFPDEYTAFSAYAKCYPSSLILLVDTYNTLKSGVPNAVRIFKELRANGIPLKNYGIRIDSGDLAYLSAKARRMLDKAGFSDAIIVVSNDLDEYLIENLKLQNAAVNVWGVGTSLITSKDCPSFGGVYKLTAVSDKSGKFLPKIKLSENTEKITTPANKTFFRVYDKASKKIRGDLICLADEVFDTDKDLLLFSPDEPWKKTLLLGGSYTMKEMLVPILKNSACVYSFPSVSDIQSYCNQEKTTLWDENKRLVHPANVYVDLSEKLYLLKCSLLHTDFN